jgi:GNAT superfamily N-acetyltransferase
MIKTRIAGFELKETTKDDADLLFDFLKEFAAHHKMLEDFSLDINDLIDSLWIKNHAEALLLYYKGEAIGFCIFYTTYSNFTGKGILFLEDVFVRDEYRGLGVGKEVMYYLSCLAQKRNYSRIEWMVVDWNEPAIKFYENVCNAKAVDGVIKYRMNQDDIDQLVQK